MKKLLFKAAFYFFIVCASAITTNAQVGNLKKGVKDNLPSKQQSATETEAKKPETKTSEAEGNPSFATITGKTIYVSPSGKNNNDGLSPATARKDLDRAIEIAQKGDVIKVSQGKYSGTMDVCLFEINESITLMGGYSADFAERDVLKYPSYILANEKSSVRRHIIFLKSDKDGNGITVDGFVFDMSAQNKYGAAVPEGLLTGYLPLTNQGGTPMRSAIASSGNNHIIRNNVFVNISKVAVSVIQQKHIPGTVQIINNVFTVIADYGIEVFGTPGSNPNQTVEIANNTFALTFGSSFANEDGGEALYLKSECNYNVHHNLFTYSSGAAIRYTSKNTLAVDNNLFFANRRNDLVMHLQNKRVWASVDDFEDLPLSSATNNKREKVELPLNKNYQNAFVNMAALTVNVEYDPNSDWNQLRSVLGLPQQATSKVDISFFANKYPIEETFKLFGVINGYGAQLPTNN